MALSIGVSVGSEIDIAGHVVKVKSIVNPKLMVITVDSGDDIVVSDKDSKVILPGVLVFTGVGANGGGNRLAFKADRSIKISRMERK